MTLQEALEFVTKNWVLIAASLMSVFEFSKIKINPWSALFKWAGSIFMADVRKDMQNMKQEITEIRKDVTAMNGEIREGEARDARTRILRCSDEVYQGTPHSKEFFDDVLDDITNYKKYCKEHPEFQNEKTVIATQRIEKVYQKCLEERTFL